MTWTVEQTSPTVTTLRIRSERKKAWEQWALITSDRHLDSPHSNRKLQTRHLDQAKERNAFVIDLGDLFDVMQGKSDPRSSKSSLDIGHKTGDYLGELTRDAVNFFTPYKDQLAVFGKGNHETQLTKRLEFDLSRMLVDRLTDAGSPCVLGGYRGWVKILFCHKKNSDVSQGANAINLFYIHGSGGAAPVTKGVIGSNRRAVIYPDAHIVVSGHIHEGWAMPITRMRLNTTGREVKDEQIHLCVPTYKDEYTDTGEGFAVEKELSPKPLGAWWIRFFYDVDACIYRYEYSRAS